MLTNVQNLQALYLKHRTTRHWTGVSAHTQSLAPGMLFFALGGHNHHAGTFMAQAARQGAAAILFPAADPCARAQAETLAATPDAPTLIPRRTPRHDLARIAALEFPQQAPYQVAVTGTNGKTSIVEFLRQAWLQQGLAAMSLGTLGLRTHAHQHDGILTSPDPLALHQALDAAVRELHISHAAFEASSHGLDQRRLDGLRLHCAVFTYLGHDHQDYHPNRSHYRRAKFSLFTRLLPPTATAVIGTDTPEGQALAKQTRQRGCTVITFGHHPTSTIAISKTSPKASTFCLDGATCTLEGWPAPLFMNACATAGVLWAQGIPAPRIFQLIQALEAPEGRMQPVTLDSAHAYPRVLIDYAHTPDALASALQAFRDTLPTHGRLWCLFGCGGQRDTAKRPMMGAVADKLADVTVITDDNPRHEDDAAIRSMIAQGIPPHRREDTNVCQIITPRSRAIAQAIQHLGADDGLLIAGKGHEAFQILGDAPKPFRDHDHARRALQQWLKRP